MCDSINVMKKRFGLEFDIDEMRSDLGWMREDWCEECIKKRWGGSFLSSVFRVKCYEKY